MLDRFSNSLITYSGWEVVIYNFNIMENFRKLIKQKNRGLVCLLIKVCQALRP